MTQVNKFYKRFEPMIHGYITKIEITDASIELCDIEQELKIKLFSSIVAYGKKWGNYRKTGKQKPFPIEFYIRTVLNNKMIDLYKQAKSNGTNYKNTDIVCLNCASMKVVKTGVERHKHNGNKVFNYRCNKCGHKFTPEVNKEQTLSKEHDSFDIGYMPTLSDINFPHKIIVIEGYDFLAGMNSMEKACMCMFFKGYGTGKLAKVFKRHFEGGYNGVLQFVEETLNKYRASKDIEEISQGIMQNTPMYSFKKSSEDNY